MTDFSESSQSNMLSPATTLIESFNKKSGSAATTPLQLSTTPTLNGTSNGGAGVGVGAGGGGPLNAGCTTVAAGLGGRQINTSSSSCSSLKETSHQSTSTSQQVRSKFPMQNSLNNSKNIQG